MKTKIKFYTFIGGALFSISILPSYVSFGEENDLAKNIEVTSSSFATLSSENKIKTLTSNSTSIDKNEEYSTDSSVEAIESVDAEPTTLESELSAISRSKGRSKVGNVVAIGNYDVDGLWIFTDDGTLSFSGGNNLHTYELLKLAERGVPKSSVKKIVFNSQLKLYNEKFDFFRGMTNLESIENFQNIDTSNATDMNGLFSGCSNLKTIDLSNFNTENVRNMSQMFYGCVSLKEIDLSVFNTSKVTNMGSMFSGCGNLTELDLSYFDTSSVSDMTQLFANCSSLRELNIKNFETSKVTSMMNMFMGCASLVELNLEHFDTSNVTKMSNMFGGCKSLVELNISHFETNKVVDMQSMFLNCNLLTVLDLSHFNTEVVTNMFQMFSNCSSLTEINLSSFNVAKVTNMRSMFNSCSSLKKIDLSHFNTPNVTDIRSMFASCLSLTEINLSDFNTSSVTDMSTLFSSDNILDTLILSSNTILTEDTDLVEVGVKKAWLDENDHELFFTSQDMVDYHNDHHVTDKYVLVDIVNLTFNTNGGIEIEPQTFAVGAPWEVPTPPTKEGYVFVGWYSDESLNTPFDFTQLALSDTTIYAKWTEAYEVEIPAKVSLNEADNFSIKGTNRGLEKSLYVNTTPNFVLENNQDSAVKTNVALSWKDIASGNEPLIVLPAEVGKENTQTSEIQMEKPTDIEAGSYSGVITFEISYK